MSLNNAECRGCRARDLHPVRRREVVPVRGRARAMVHPRGVARPAAAHAAGAQADEAVMM
jgi:hypothetical protein